MNKTKFVKGLIFSFLLHVTFVVAVFAVHFNQSQDVQKWSGGHGTTINYIYVSISDDVGISSFADIDSNEPVQSLKSVKKNKIVVKSSINKIQKKAQSKIKRGDAPTGFGIGNSDTPAGGIGQGMDKTGVISKNAPSVIAKIRKRILRNKIFPKQAKKNNQTGQVKVQFLIHQDGHVDQLKVVKGSGHAILDDAALSTIKRSQPLPYLPSKIALTLEYQLLN